MKPNVLFCCFAILAAGCGRCHRCGIRVPVAPTPAVQETVATGPVSKAAPEPPPIREFTPAVGPRVSETAAERTIREQVRIIDGMLADAYFDYDQYRLRADAMDALRESARLLAKAMEAEPGARLVVEGHCDERGSGAYNLALGEARAQKAREFLAEIGLPAPRIDTISMGEERPACGDATEDCWRRNRRVHLRYSTAP